jgi:SAM-dependent methyltransferase
MERRTSTVLKAWLFHAEIAAWLIALGLALAAGERARGPGSARGRPAVEPEVARPDALLHALGALVPRGPHSPARVQRLLLPRSGERILEIGPGVGVPALPVAAALLPDGVLDVQRQMLDDLMRRAAREGLTNVVPRRGDAQHLPYPDATFDAAYLISVLGEIPDAPAALSELRRVLKPGGRLLVGEVLVDPDFIALPALKAMAGDAGFALERRAGPRFAYSAVFRRTAG